MRICNWCGSVLRLSVAIGCLIACFERTAFADLPPYCTYTTTAYGDWMSNTKCIRYEYIPTAQNAPSHFCCYVATTGIQAIEAKLLDSQPAFSIAGQIYLYGVDGEWDLPGYPKKSCGQAYGKITGIFTPAKYPAGRSVLLNLNMSANGSPIGEDEDFYCKIMLGQSIIAQLDPQISSQTIIVNAGEELSFEMYAMENDFSPSSWGPPSYDRTFTFYIQEASAILYVDASNTGGPWDGSQPHPYRTIQDGINASLSGDTVIVAPEHYYENVILNGKNITVTSTEPNDPNIVAATIIDGNDANSVMRIVDANATVEGFTITRGASIKGGGIYCSDGVLTIKNCIVSGNRTINGEPNDARGDGGGLYFLNSAATIEKCTISENATCSGLRTNLSTGNYNDYVGGYGGGVYASSSILTFNNCSITDNITGHGGGYTGLLHFGAPGGSGAGICCESSSLAMMNCLIRHNVTGADGIDGTIHSTSGSGGGVFCVNSTTSIVGCTITANKTGDGNSGPYVFNEGGNSGNGGGIFLQSSSEASITDSIITGNITGHPSRGELHPGSSGHGGGIFSTCPLIIVGCQISSNSTSTAGSAGDQGGNAGRGGGISCSSAQLINCVVVGNSTGNGGNGEGAFPVGRPAPGGNGGSGAGIFCYSSAIINCTVANNITGQGGLGTYGPSGSHGYGAGIFCDSSSVITNTIVWNNSADQLYGQDCNKVTYCDIGGGLCGGGIGNMSSEPLFADSNNGNYHLKSQYGRWDPNTSHWVYDGVISPCIDAGDPNSDWTQELWPHGGRTNMGAYGGTVEASMSALAVGDAVDFNLDGMVDFCDFAKLSSLMFVHQNLLAEDIDRNGIVDIRDIQVFCEHWLMANDVTAANLIGMWKFDEGSGTTAHDSSGHNNNGTFINSPVWTTGKKHGGLDFDGIDDAIQVGTGQMNVSAGTIALWGYAKQFADAPRYLIGEATKPTNETWANRIQLYVLNTTGSLCLGLGDQHFKHTDIEVLQINQWYHIALTWNNGLYAVYINGIAKASGSFTGLSALNNFADIGNDGNTTYRNEAWGGVIDDVRIYNRALSANEVLYLAQKLK